MPAQPIVVRGKIRLKNIDPGDFDGLDKKKTRKRTDILHRRIADLQQLLFANSSHSILMIFQGMDASGKDGSIRSLLEHVNPTGVQIANFKVPSEEERAHDYLWRVHKVLPRFGYLGVFNRSHYEAVLAERVLKIVPRKIWRQRFAQIVDFERMLVENNVVLLKFHLHISREEQARRFEERLANPHKHWKFSQADLKTRQFWNDYVDAYEEMLNVTSHAAARWRIVPADHNWYRNYVIANAVVRALEGLRLRWPKLKKDFDGIKIK